MPSAVPSWCIYSAEHFGVPNIIMLSAGTLKWGAYIHYTLECKYIWPSAGSGSGAYMSADMLGARIYYMPSAYACSGGAYMSATCLGCIDNAISCHCSGCIYVADRLEHTYYMAIG